MEHDDYSLIIHFDRLYANVHHNNNKKVIRYFSIHFLYIITKVSMIDSRFLLSHVFTSHKIKSYSLYFFQCVRFDGGRKKNIYSGGTITFFRVSI